MRTPICPHCGCGLVRLGISKDKAVHYEHDGVLILGPSADELINFFALAIRRGITADELKDVIFAYPTHASDLKYLV